MAGQAVSKAVFGVLL